MLKSFIVLIAGALCLAGIAQAEVVAPDVLIRNTAQEVIDIVKKDTDIKAGNQAKILALVDAKVLPNFDFARMTQLAVGKYWRTASQSQKQALVTEFRNMLVRTYTKAFSLYRDQTLEVAPLSLASGDSEAMVKSRILKQGGQATTVDYRMRKTDDGWKVFDVSIEGVSMVTSYRGTFDTQIQQSGIDGLIKTLTETNAGAHGKADTK